MENIWNYQSLQIDVRVILKALQLRKHKMLKKAEFKYNNYIQI